MVECCKFFNPIILIILIQTRRGKLIAEKTLEKKLIDKCF